jgi:predicted DNA-binding transcriptional regulator AlpA
VPTAKKQVAPRPNRISKKKKGIVTVGEVRKHDAALPVTPDHLPHVDPGHGPSARGPPPPGGALFIDAAQLLARYGGKSDMWLVRMLERDPTFPRPKYFGGGRRRFWSITDLEQWERMAAPKAS